MKKVTRLLVKPRRFEGRELKSHLKITKKQRVVVGTCSFCSSMDEYVLRIQPRHEHGLEIRLCPDCHKLVCEGAQEEPEEPDNE